MTVPSSAIPWLLQKDNPGVRYLALRDLVGLRADDDELIQAKRSAYRDGAIGTVLKDMHPDGYWEKPGPGYNPKYTSTVWSLILLSQLGASVDDDRRIRTACSYYLEHAITKEFSFSANGTPSGTVYCLQGNMCAALTALGYEHDVLDTAYETMANNLLGRSRRYYASTCGPHFVCGINGKKPCAWGAVKVLSALGKVPLKKRTPLIREAIERSAAFFFGTDPVTAAYLTRDDSKPSRNWWKFGFPVFYVTDLLQLAEALVAAGYGHDTRMKNTLDYIWGKQDTEGRWMLEYGYTGKTWGEYGNKGEVNKWVTYRATKLLRAAGYH
jgi:hypothetical protein